MQRLVQLEVTGMGAMSRRKGATGELQLASEITALTSWGCTRAVRQHPGDSDIQGCGPWVIEVKRRAGRITQADVRRWWTQAAAQATKASDYRPPMLAYRGDREPWRAVWSHLLVSGHPVGVIDWGDYDQTCTSTLAVWAEQVRMLAVQMRTTPPGTSADLPRRRLDIGAYTGPAP